MAVCGLGFVAFLDWGAIMDRNLERDDPGSRRLVMLKGIVMLKNLNRIQATIATFVLLAILAVQFWGQSSVPIETREMHAAVLFAGFLIFEGSAVFMFNKVIKRMEGKLAELDKACKEQYREGSEF